MDSKDLIEACAKIGIILKNSALASISPEEKDKVLDFLRESGSGTTAAPATTKAVPLAPVRETAKPVGAKVREIRDMVPQPTLARAAARPASSVVSAEASDQESAVAVEEPPSIPDSPEVEPVNLVTETVDPIVTATVEPTVDTSAVTAADVVAPVVEAPGVTQAVVVEEPPAAVVAEATIEAVEDDGGDAPAATPTAPAAPEGKAKAPLSRNDYIAPHGSSSGGRSGVMMARGTVDLENARNQAQKRQQKSRPGPILPNIVSLAEFKGPTQAPSAPAQKPDLRLPMSVISGARPLDDILKKKAEDKKKTDDKGKDRNAPRRTVMLTDADLEEVSKKKGAKVVGADLSASRKERQTRRTRTGGVDEDFGSQGKLKHRRNQRHTSSAGQLKTEAEIELPISVRSLSEAIGRPASALLKALFARGAMITINALLDEETAVELAMELGVDLQIKYGRDLEHELFEGTEESDTPEQLVSRPPLITILGHVDHGKTTLLDKIRSANVAAGEAGGITQHIAAYQVEHNGQKLTFVDTPGHAAFSEMRARGANVTDIVVLVVAADDGVMPQTEEAISHAKAAGVPIIVAMNKCDLPGRNEQRVLQDLSAHGILPVEWGGDVEVIRTSGTTGLGIDHLLETLLLTAELHDYKSNPEAPAAGVCLEAFRDEGRGSIAWLMVQRGTLRVGDVVICGEAHGRIRNITNDRGQEITEAPPSTPVKVSGLDVVPGAGDKFAVSSDLDSARELAEDRRARERNKMLASKVKPRTLEDVLDLVKGGGVRELPLILKADAPGSLEALRHELGRFSHPEVRVRMIHEAIGGVNESDVYLATATGAIIIAFHVVPEDRARVLAEREGVEIREYQIIYEVTDHIKLALEGLLRPEIQQVSTGRAIVLRTFFISRVGGTIAGCRVLNGTIDRSSKIRIIRDHRVLNEYGIGSLKREKDDVREVREGYECGIRLDHFNDIKEGDLFEAFRIEEVKRTL